MIVFDQIISFVLWTATVFGVGAFDAVLTHHERAGVWYKAGGKVHDKDAAKAESTWFGKLRKTWIMPSSTVGFIIAGLAYLALMYAGWRLWINDALHTNTFGILAISFLLGDVLFIALYSPMMYLLKSVIAGTFNMVLQLLLTAAAATMVGILTWRDGVIPAVTTFIAICVYAAYCIFQVIYHGMLYSAQEKSSKKKKNRNADYDAL